MLVGSNMPYKAGDSSRMPSRSLARLLICLLIITMFPLLAPAPAKAAASGKVYLILVDKLSIDDINSKTMPRLTELAANGAAGLASNRTLNQENTGNCGITIGAGNLGRTYSYGLLGYNYEEYILERATAAGPAYKALNGMDAESGNIVLLNISELRDRMASENVSTVPGQLGEELGQAGYRVALLGNSDLPGQMNRFGVVVAMNAEGVVPMGDVGPATVRQPESGFMGMETDYDYLRKKLEQIKPEADLIVLELADLYRYRAGNLALEPAATQERQRVYTNVDGFIGYIADQADPANDLILVMSISPAQIWQSNQSGFTPIIAAGKNFPAGALSSATTRRDSVVANTDIAPTILAFFGVENDSGTMIGRVMQSKPLKSGQTSNITQAVQIKNETQMTNSMREPIIRLFVGLLILAMLLTCVALFIYKRVAAVANVMLTAMAAVSIVVLLSGLLVGLSTFWYMALILVLPVAITWLTLKLTKNDYFLAFTILAAVMLLMINADIIAGAGIIQKSILGYDIAVGARYYGVGNEYCGMLIGASILLAARVYEKYRKRWILLLITLVFAGQCLVAGLPDLGAQSDGFLSMPIAFLFVLVLLADIRVRPRLVLAIVLFGIVLMAGLAMYDMSQPVELQSHVGRAAYQVFNGGWKEGLKIILRKIDMNLNLMMYTIWTGVFMIMLVSLALLIYRPLGAVKHMQERYPYLTKGIGGGLAAAFLVFGANDSGIVSASTTSIYIVLPMLLLLLRLEDGKNATLAEKIQ